MKKVEVNLKDKSYPVFVGSGILNKLSQLIEQKKLPQNYLIVVDKNVMQYWDGEIKRCFNNSVGKKHFYLFTSNESRKSLNEIKRIYSALIQNNFGRDTLLISIGGGVCGDTAGFVASTFIRGILLVHIPTTLLACIDSAIGGKTGFNFEHYKNIIGTFYQPKFVFIDSNFLSTLPLREMNSGLGELVKYAFISSPEFYQFIEEKREEILLKDKTIIQKAIIESVQFKSSVVSNDEQDKGLRKILNFGHTFAHAIEKESKFKISHGEAVAAGIACAVYLSFKKKLITNDRLNKFLSLPRILQMSKPLKKIDIGKIYFNMFADKKNRNGQLKFVLIRNVGELVLNVDASKNDVLYAIENGLASLNYAEKKI